MKFERKFGNISAKSDIVCDIACMVHGFLTKKIFWQPEPALFFGSVARPGPARKFYFTARPDPKILMKTRLDPTRDFCSPTQPEPDKMPARHIPRLHMHSRVLAFGVRTASPPLSLPRSEACELNPLPSLFEFPLAPPPPSFPSSVLVRCGCASVRFRVCLDPSLWPRKEYPPCSVGASRARISQSCSDSTRVQ